MNNQEKDFLQKQIAGLTGKKEFTLTDKDYNTFLQLVKGMTFEAGTSEMALAFITTAIMDKDKLISERNKREEDFPALINIIIDIYRHAFDPKSTLLLLTQALDRHIKSYDREFKLALFKGETSFQDAIDLIRKPIKTQPGFNWDTLDEVEPSSQPEKHIHYTSMVNKMFYEVANGAAFEKEKGIITNLPKGHTLDQRIKELNDLTVKYKDEPDTLKYILSKIKHLALEMSDSGYQVLQMDLFDITQKAKPFSF